MLKKILAVTGLILPMAANAALMDSINALNPGDQYRVMLVTSTLTDATSDDIGYYNTIANNAGTTGSVTSGLGLTWKAMASTAAVDACVNTGSCAPDASPVTIFNTKGEVFADSYTDLWHTNGLRGGIKYTEHGITGSESAWTGTYSTGVGAGTVALGERYGAYGHATCSPGSCFWMFYDVGLDMSFNRSVYALSEETTVVSIPASPWLFGSALVALFGVGRRKKARASHLGRSPVAKGVRALSFSQIGSRSPKTGLPSALKS